MYLVVNINLFTTHLLNLIAFPKVIYFVFTMLNKQLIVPLLIPQSKVSLLIIIACQKLWLPP